jgi:spermidine/putrescine transport system ATP-binding protein
MTAADSATRPAAERDLRLESVTKRFGSFVAVDRLDLVVPQGSFFGLLGPSGCGKTTTLRMVAGLEQPTSGHIVIGGIDMAGVKPYRRPVNTVFQSYALFPHLSIADNVAFGLRRRGVKDVRRQVSDMLELVELQNHANKKPDQLSGGQQQRVALARALINRPEVLLLDEPLGALDLRLRRQMQIELKRIQSEVGLTFVHVTHDQEEAMTMADTIAVMNKGVIEQMGTPEGLYESPRTTFVANFLGQSNLIEAEVVDAGGEGVQVAVAGKRMVVDKSRASVQQGRAWLGVRPEKVRIATGTPRDQVNVIDGGVVSDASFVGVSTQYLVRTPWGQDVAVFEQNTGVHRVFAPGTAVSLYWDPRHAFLLDHGQDAQAGFEQRGGSA